ncbi:hypothetical protein F4820DRAFT_435454 [Hypoxylon rubiginosum]|uniref:Uncharacterized protein n=1 Tax=Hypoxylon rubiginosum TaxID=110542 RepID=A0ACB9YPG9_9PEZI|nr:hypothetical protein F4820DRAFT_435454 [Hypoxylon rubiginosum]
MFITFKNPNGPDNSAMEQVAVTNASSASTPTRSIRKAACIACQAKKLRCTGRTRDCDRCKARSIACIFPGKLRSGSTPGLAKHNNSREETIQLDGFTDTDNGDRVTPPISSKSQQAILEDTPDSDFMSGDIFNLFAKDNIGFHLDAFNQDIAPIDGSPSVVTADPMNRGDDSRNTSQRVLSPHGPALATPPLSDPGRHNSDDGISWNSPPSCSCINDAVRVIQQLDDDEFRITTLSLDQVLQLQKWIIAQCCKPIECPNCVCLPAVHSVLLIICDRLTEMFECIHKRIRRASTALSEQGSLQIAIASSQSDELGSVAEARAQLFCNSTGRAAGSATCNLQLFSSELCAQYSDEEQVHMIRILLKLQIRNFRQLLSRVDNANQIAGSQARRSKVGAMVSRLGKANADIEDALQIIFQTIASS